jgi:hypothetical protein
MLAAPVLAGDEYNISPWLSVEMLRFASLATGELSRESQK